MAKKKDSRRFESEEIGALVRLAEDLLKATVVTYEIDRGEAKGRLRPGGSCSCCGAGPKRLDEPYDWWLVFKAGLPDSDGVYYAQLCSGPLGGCLTDIRDEDAKRKPTVRDEAAAIITDLMGDDIDGAQSFMDDLDFHMDSLGIEED